MKVFILRGLPGSGKTTLANRLWPNARRRFSSDDFFTRPDGTYDFRREELPQAHRDCLRQFTECCRDFAAHPSYEVTVIVDNTNLSVAEMAPYVAVAEAYGHDVEVVTVLASPELALARNIHGVPPETFTVMQTNFADGSRSMPPWWKHLAITVSLPEGSS